MAGAAAACRHWRRKWQCQQKYRPNAGYQRVDDRGKSAAGEADDNDTGARFARGGSVRTLRIRRARGEASARGYTAGDERDHEHDDDHRAAGASGRKGHGGGREHHDVVEEDRWHEPAADDETLCVSPSRERVAVLFDG